MMSASSPDIIVYSGPVDYPHCPQTAKISPKFPRTFINRICSLVAFMFKSAIYPFELFLCNTLILFKASHSHNIWTISSWHIKSNQYLLSSVLAKPSIFAVFRNKHKVWTPPTLYSGCYLAFLCIIPRKQINF